MRLREAVLGASLLLTGCEKSPCEKVVAHVEEGSYGTWHDGCDKARAELNLAQTAQQQCPLDLSVAIEKLRSLIKQNCDTK